MKVQVGAITDVGKVRKANEDSVLVDGDLFVFAVADGMGGHNAGEIASAVAIETIRATTASGIDIEEAIKRANTAVRNKAARRTFVCSPFDSVLNGRYKASS